MAQLQLQLLQSLTTLNSTIRFFPSRNPSLNPPVLTRRAISPFCPTRRFPRPESIRPMSRFHHLCRMKNSGSVSFLRTKAFFERPLNGANLID